MKKAFLFTIAILFNFHLFAQTDVEMGDVFSLSGNSFFFFKTAKLDKGSKPSSKIWHIEGTKDNENNKKILFWLTDKTTSENSDSAEWRGDTKVTKRVDKKGNASYLVHDNDSIYLTVITIMRNLSAVQMYTKPVELVAEEPQATEGKWEIIRHQADELKGNESYTSYEYKQPGMGSFIFWGYDEYQYRIHCDNGIFNYESTYNRYTGSYTGQTVTVGLYDSSDKLIDKFTMWLDKESDKNGSYLKTRNAGSMSNPVGQKGKVKKILNHLKGNEGYVRILAPRYNRTDFDIKILPVNNK